MSKVQKKEDSILPGQLTSVLTQEYVVATQTEGYDQKRVKLAFTSRKLPSKEETLKMFLYPQEVSGPRNGSVQEKSRQKLFTRLWSSGSWDLQWWLLSSIPPDPIPELTREPVSLSKTL